MNKLELLQNISKYLARFSEQVKILNKAGDFSINKIAEDILIELLNNAFDLQLENPNNSVKENYPAIDLIDYNNRTAFQVTSTSDLQKVKNSLTKFYTNNLYEGIDKLYLYILTEKQDSYSDLSIKKHIQFESQQSNQEEIEFNSKDHIIDKRDIFKKYYHTNSVEKIARVERYLGKNFGLLSLKDELSSYYEGLKNLFYEVVFENESGMTLKDIYIDPAFAIYENHVEGGSKMTVADHQHSFLKSKHTSSLNDFLFGFITQKRSYNLKVKESKCLLLLGYPGQGKTSCLKKLLNYYLLDGRDNKKDIFYFKLKNIRQGKLLVESPINVLFEEACNDTNLELNKLNFRKSILLLDGLDELFMKENMKLDDIEKICKEISREAERYSDLVVIITSRFGYIELNKLQKENCLFIQIAPFNVDDQIKWTEKFQRFHETSWLTKEKIIEFNQPNNHNYVYIRELISQPILLQIIASLNNEIKSNSTRAQIYSRLFTELIERRYSRDGQLENFHNITQEDLRLLIQEIAFLIHKSGNGYVTQKELLNHTLIAEYLSKFPNQDFSNNIKGILISFYFREHKQESASEDTAIEFLHKSLQEYMTAEKIDRTIYEKFLDRNRKGAYIISSFEPALGELIALFAYQPISWEIKEYIIDLIEGHDVVEKEELSNRLFTFIEEFVEHDFLLYYDTKHNHPIEMSLQTFLGYWMYLTRCNWKRNFLESQEVKERIIDYLVLAAKSNYIRESIEFLTFQDLSSCRIDNLEIYEAILSHTSFMNCNLNNLSIYETDVNSCDFSNSVSFKAEFVGCKIINTSFEESDFELCEFSHTEFENVSFAKAYFARVTFDHCRFMKMKKNSFDKMKLTENAIVEFMSLDYKVDLTRSFFIDNNRNLHPITPEFLEQLKKEYPIS